MASISSCWNVSAFTRNHEKGTVVRLPFASASCKMLHRDHRFHHGPKIALVAAKLSDSSDNTDDDAFENPSAENRVSARGYLLGVISEAEKYITLLYQARIKAIEDRQKILYEKETLQEKILRTSAPESKLIAFSKIAEAKDSDVKGYIDRILSKDRKIHSLKDENGILESGKTLLNALKNNGELLVVLIKEISVLDWSLKVMESRLSPSHKDMPELCNLRAECQGLGEKLEILKSSLAKDLKQADQAIILLQHNLDLFKKLDALEASIEKADHYKLSTKFFKMSDDRFAVKAGMMESHRLKSDEEISHYFQLFQLTILSFQDKLDTIKEEISQMASDSPLEEIHREFWRLRNLISAMCEKNKFDAALVSEKVWKRDRHDTACKENGEHETISHIAAEAKAEQGGQHKDFLLVMKRDALKKINLLDQIVEDLDGIFAENKAAEADIKMLKMRVVETEALMKVSTEEVIHAEQIEGQLEKLRIELGYKIITAEGEEILQNLNSSEDGESNLDYYQTRIDSQDDELNSLREKNVILKQAIELIKTQLKEVPNNDDCLAALEKERWAFSDSALASLSTLRVQRKNLCDEVADLQSWVDTRKNHNFQSIMLQKNMELQKKISDLEAALVDDSFYRSFRMHKFGELLKQNVQIFESHCQKSVEELKLHVMHCQRSLKAFEDMVDRLKKASKRTAWEEPVEDTAFLSQFLDEIDRCKEAMKHYHEMLWEVKMKKRESCMAHMFMVYEEQAELEAVSIMLAPVKRPKLYVVQIAAELAPVAKVGGLAEFVRDLAISLQKKGNHCEIILPKFDCMQYENILDLRVLDVVVESFFDDKLVESKIWACTIEGLQVYLIEPDHTDKFFNRGKEDDIRRFWCFCRAALEFLLLAGKKPDIIHCHDWQTALIAPLHRYIYASQLNSAKICFTCHDFGNQGFATPFDLEACGLNSHLNTPERMQDNSKDDSVYSFFGVDRVNSVKGGIVFSDIVTTVSPAYAQEVKTAEGGHGLHSILSANAYKVFGINYGIDYNTWNPANDSFLQVHYNENYLRGKADNKEGLRRRLGLSSSDVRRPLVGCITRLDSQNAHHIRHVIHLTLQLGGQFVLLGSSSVSHHLQKEFEDIATHYQNHDDVKLILKEEDESLSHAIYAASDMFIDMSSISERCGVKQMIAMRYGAVPIAKKTGDSVFDVEDVAIPSQSRNGFTFLDANELVNALERAFHLFKNHPQSWTQLVQKVMVIDNSWDSAAGKYEDIYFKSVTKVPDSVTF